MRRLRSASEVQDFMSLRPYNMLLTFLVTFSTCGRQDRQESKVIPRLKNSSTKGTQAPLLLTTILEIFKSLKELTVVDEPKTIVRIFIRGNGNIEEMSIEFFRQEAMESIIWLR